MTRFGQVTRGAIRAIPVSKERTPCTRRPPFVTMTAAPFAP